MKAKNPRRTCFLCRKRNARHWVTVADYVSIGGFRVEAPGFKVGLCEKCHLGKGLMDMSFYREINRRLCEIFAKGETDEQDAVAGEA